MIMRKKIGLYALALVVLSTAVVVAGNAIVRPAETTPASQSGSKVTQMDEALFTSKIGDFKSSGWKFSGTQPAVVDFYATWCPPCKMIAPIMDELSVEYDGRVSFYKVDIDQQQTLSSAMKIKSIPTLYFYAPGAEPKEVIGSKSKDEFKKIIDGLLK